MICNNCNDSSIFNEHMISEIGENDFDDIDYDDQYNPYFWPDETSCEDYDIYIDDDEY